jgi:hypothetical protein
MQHRFDGLYNIRRDGPDMPIIVYKISLVMVSVAVRLVNCKVVFRMQGVLDIFKGWGGWWRGREV